jgi:hypothetical protein
MPKAENVWIERMERPVGSGEMFCGPHSLLTVIAVVRRPLLDSSEHSVSTGEQAHLHEKPPARLPGVFGFSETGAVTA